VGAIDGSRALRPVVVLDDDPTGVQTLAGVRALLAWSPASVADAVSGRGAVHLVTNARALSPEEARRVTVEAARAARQGVPDAVLVLRGDSTLRGHVREELEALATVVSPGGMPPVLLVPALPSAGRVTLGGVHYLEQDGRRVPLHETEYARDGIFAYTSARLLEWAEERTAGLLRAEDGRELPLADLRRDGASLVASALRELEVSGRPGALVPDVEDMADVELVARGYEQALAGGVSALVRCAPAFAGALSGTTAAGPATLPQAQGALVVCGSYLSGATAQLAELAAAYPSRLVEVDVEAFASGDAENEVARAASTASRILADKRLAVLATPRVRPPGTQTLEAGARIGAGLARAAAAVAPRPDCVIVKGGITSFVTLREGFGETEAEVIGPLRPGVSLWRAGDLDYVVVPGNVGDDRLLVELVDGVLGRR
jgi:uncharacterized protein YgbK (DUF1537 family)